jgi:hypothetical protein
MMLFTCSFHIEPQEAASRCGERYSLNNSRQRSGERQTANVATVLMLREKQAIDGRNQRQSAGATRPGSSRAGRHGGASAGGVGHFTTLIHCQTGWVL